MTFTKNIYRRIGRLTTSQISILFTAIALLVFYPGLSGDFQGDDHFQIVDNLAVHSLKNLPDFFGASTFFNGQTLVGSFYRPMMTVTYALLYALFGPAPAAFHIFQLFMLIAGALLLYIFASRYVRPAAALLLSLIVLVHPANSQIGYAIPSMQEVLFFGFGMGALVVLQRYRSLRSMAVAAGLLLLSLLSKETGALFVALALLQLWLFERRRLKVFALFAAGVVLAYGLLRLHAVGLAGGALHASPISDMNLAQRLLNLPAIILFYLTKFVFPWELATGYYWVVRSFSLQQVVVPLLVDGAVVAGFIWLWRRVRERLPKRQQRAFILFAAMAALNLLLHAQLLPLDMTVSEPWLLLSGVGLLGMLAVAARLVAWRRWLVVALAASVVVLILLGARTFMRGFDYRDQATLARKDISVGDNYFAMNNLAQSLLQAGDPVGAASYARRSITLYPTATNYTNLGVALQMQNNYQGAKTAYQSALRYGNLSIIYENLGILALSYESPAGTVSFLRSALKVYPYDYKLWTYLAIRLAEDGDKADAKQAIVKAAAYGPVPEQLRQAVEQGKPFTMQLPYSGKLVEVK